MVFRTQKSNYLIDPNKDKIRTRDSIARVPVFPDIHARRTPSSSILIYMPINSLNTATPAEAPEMIRFHSRRRTRKK